MDIRETDRKYVLNTYARYPLVIKHARGSVAYDENDNEYIDLGSGIGVNAFGYCDEEWCNAVKQQLDTVQHTSNLYYTEPCAKLAKMLCERTGLKKVFFSNSGAEANECAVKAARKYAADVKGDFNCTIVTVKGSFHGRTHTTLAATGQEAFHKLFTPLTSGFAYCEPTADSLLKTVEETNAVAVMFEVVRGEGGVVAIDDSFAAALKALSERGILLIADEVQTGNGRTGELYAYMHYGLKPDVVTTAKGLGGGLPIGATMLGERVADLFSAGSNGSTFGGNPIACAGALNILGRLDEKMLGEIREKSRFVFDKLQGKKGIKAVTGLGLMIGLETDIAAAEVAARCLKRGVLVLTAKQKVRLLPPLNIPSKLLEKAVDVIIDVCGEE